MADATARTSRPGLCVYLFGDVGLWGEANDEMRGLDCTNQTWEQAVTNDQIKDGHVKPTPTHINIQTCTHARTLVPDGAHPEHPPARESLVEGVEARADQPPEAADEEEEGDLPHRVVDACLWGWIVLRVVGGFVVLVLGWLFWGCVGCSDTYPRRRTCRRRTSVFGVFVTIWWYNASASISRSPNP